MSHRHTVAHTQCTHTQWHTHSGTHTVAHTNTHTDTDAHLPALDTIAGRLGVSVEEVVPDLEEESGEHCRSPHIIYDI